MQEIGLPCVEVLRAERHCSCAILLTLLLSMERLTASLLFVLVKGIRNRTTTNATFRLVSVLAARFSLEPHAKTQATSPSSVRMRQFWFWAVNRSQKQQTLVKRIGRRAAYRSSGNARSKQGVVSCMDEPPPWLCDRRLEPSAPHILCEASEILRDFDLGWALGRQPYPSGVGSVLCAFTYLACGIQCIMCFLGRGGRDGRHWFGDGAFRACAARRTRPGCGVKSWKFHQGC